MQHGRSQSDVPSTKNVFNLVLGIPPNTARTTGNECTAGAHIFSMDVYVNAITPSASNETNFNYYIAFRRQGQASSALPEADFSDIGLSNMRNQIIFSDLNQLGTEDAGPLRRKHHIKIPQMYQRVREGDQWDLIYGHTDAVETNLGFRAKCYW